MFAMCRLLTARSRRPAYYTLESLFHSLSFSFALSRHSINCSLYALLDTDSPVLFINPAVYKSHFKELSKSFSATECPYKAVNHTLIHVIGSVSICVILDSLPELSLKVDLLVLEKDRFSIDLLLGRNFFQSNKLSVLYNPSSKEEQTLRLFSEVASAEIVTKDYNNSKFL